MSNIVQLRHISTIQYMILFTVQEMNRAIQQLQHRKIREVRFIFTGKKAVMMGFTTNYIHHVSHGFKCRFQRLLP